ncbi:hypothetical protein BVX97_04970 [bacterium E08(2017)]|nr:hypothetical protein BVX97_04970 [bacterium E08(2017)]
MVLLATRANHDFTRWEHEIDMALVHPDMNCPFCGDRLGDDQSNIIGFTFLDIRHRDFECLDDSACHRSCLSQWEKRDDFITFWNQQLRASLGFDAQQLFVDQSGLVDYRDNKNASEAIDEFLNPKEKAPNKFLHRIFQTARGLKKR